MWKWLAFAAVLPLVSATAANAQRMKGLDIADVASIAQSRALDLRLAQEHSFNSRTLLKNDMIAQQSVAPNALVGLGLARIYSRKKRGDARITDQLSIDRKPAVTFVLKF